jgi:hypothetical protein
MGRGRPAGDDQEAYFRGLLGWIKDVEAGRTGKRKG